MIQLRARAGLRSGRGRWLVPPWIAPAFILCALILIVWAGFLIVALVVTAIAVVRRSPYAEVAAAISGTLLVCDAWFDVLTSRTTGELVQASVEAALVELPLAALCFWMATNLARAVEVARPFLRAAGFRIERNRLVPPEDSGGS